MKLLHVDLCGTPGTVCGGTFVPFKHIYQEQERLTANELSVQPWRSDTATQRDETEEQHQGSRWEGEWTNQGSGSALKRRPRQRKGQEMPPAGGTQAPGSFLLRVGDGACAPKPLLRPIFLGHSCLLSQCRRCQWRRGLSWCPR